MEAELEAYFLDKSLQIDDIKIFVGFKYSKYMKMSLGEELDVLFNQRHFEKLTAAAEEISSNIRTKSAFTIAMSATKHVATTSETDTEPSVVEFVNTSPKHRRLVMTGEQWEKFVEHIPELKKMFSSNVVYKHKDCITWSLHPDRAREGHEDTNIHQLWTRLVPKCCDKCLLFLLRGFVIKEKLYSIASKECFGCANSKSSQRDHMEAGCLSPIKELLVYFERANTETNFRDMLKKLSFEMSWPVAKLPHVGSSTLVQKVVCDELEVLCDECRPLKRLYDDLFDHLGFGGE